VLVGGLVLKQQSSDSVDAAAAAALSGGLSGWLSTAFTGFTLLTLIPPALNAGGGVTVGYVIKYAGGVKKGFATTFGILLTGLFDWLHRGTQPSQETYVALPLVVVASMVYTMYPYRAPAAEAKKAQ
jgi:hypothetical protein